jgi:hypothetical protein
MTEQEMRNRVRVGIEAAGGPRTFAAMHGFTDKLVADVVHDRQEPTDRLLAMVGIVRIGPAPITYWEQ